MCPLSVHFFRSVFVLIWQTHTHLNCCLLRRLLSFSQFPKTVVSLKGRHTPALIPVLTLFFLKKTPQIPAWLWLVCHLFYLWSRLYTLSRPHSEKPLGLKELLLDLIFQNFSAVFIAYWVSSVLFCAIPFSLHCYFFIQTFLRISVCVVFRGSNLHFCGFSQGLASGPCLQLANGFFHISLLLFIKVRQIEFISFPNHSFSSTNFKPALCSSRKYNLTSVMSIYDLVSPVSSAWTIKINLVKYFC